MTLQSIKRLEAHILAERYRGYDPYDALMSPAFRLPGLRSSRILRLRAQQVLRRSPVNLRPLLGIRKGYNPVTLALVLEAYAYLAQAEPQRASELQERGAECVRELRRLRSPGYHGDCWGYDFDWEGRYARIPAGFPTIVATGLVTNALFVAHELLGLDEGLELCAGAMQFVLNDLHRTEAADGTFCWSYSPSDRQQVLNATMKGARLCAQVYAATGDVSGLESARQTTKYVVAHQRHDGAWPYAVGDARTWVDNFHTGYVLDALDTYGRLADDSTFDSAKKQGWSYYRANFFVDDRIPKYYDNQLYPIDATACAQSLLTLCRFGDVETAQRVANWAVAKMQCPDGHFAYQLRQRIKITTPYMRWASAYMYAGLSRLAQALAPAA
jgi:hypothetical protein